MMALQGSMKGVTECGGARHRMERCGKARAGIDRRGGSKDRPGSEGATDLKAEPVADEGGDNRQKSPKGNASDATSRPKKRAKKANHEFATSTANWAAYW